MRAGPDNLAKIVVLQMEKDNIGENKGVPFGVPYRSDQPIKGETQHVAFGRIGSKMNHLTDLIMFIEQTTSRKAENSHIYKTDRSSHRIKGVTP